MSARKLFNRCRSTAQTLISTSLVIASSAMADVVGEVQWIRDGANGIDRLQCGRDMVSSPDQRFVYHVSFCDEAINIFSRDPESGRLSFIENLVFNEEEGEGIHPNEMLEMSPDGKYIYVSGDTGVPGNEANNYRDAIFIYERDQETGLLTKVHEYSGRGLSNIAEHYMSQDGQYLYVFNHGAAIVFQRSANGFISEAHFINEISKSGRTYTLPDIAVSPDESYMFVLATSNTFQTLVVFSRNPETGDLEHLREFSSQDESLPGFGNMSDLAVSHDGQHLYVFSDTSGEDRSLWHFSVGNNGSLEFKGKYFPPENPVVSRLVCPEELKLSSNDRLLYFVDDCSSTFQVWETSEVDGSLSFLGAQEDDSINRDIFSQIDGVSISQDQRYAYISDTYSIMVLDLAADTHLDLTAPSAVLPGSEFQVELEVTNLGAASAHGIRTEMELPTGVELVSAQPFGNATECAQEGQAVVCRIPGLDNGEAEEITVTLRADGESSAVELEASMSQYQVDPDMSNSRDSVRIARSDSADDSDEDSDSESDSGNTDGTDNNDGEADSSDSDSSGGGGSTGVGFLLMMAAAVLMRRSRELSH